MIRCGLAKFKVALLCEFNYQYENKFYRFNQKGSLHTDEFMSAVLSKEKGLCTDKRMSHVFALEMLAYEKLLFLTDCAINSNSIVK